jgi:hypothetical protein
MGKPRATILSIAERIASLCRLLADDDLQRLAAEAGAGPLLARIVASVNAGNQNLAALEHDLDALDEALARLGLDGVTTSVRLHQPRPAAPDTPAPDLGGGWTCPLEECSRVEPGAASSGPAPVCGFSAQPMQNILSTIDQASTLPITIYLSDETTHQQVETAIDYLLAMADLRVELRDRPVLGSWFRRMWASRVTSSPLARDIAMTAAHAAESRITLAQDAAVTAAMLQNLGPVITALQPTKDAAIRVGALLIIKLDWVVTVHQLTAAQQLKLDHQPRLAASPQDLMAALELIPVTPPHSPVEHTRPDL